MIRYLLYAPIYLAMVVLTYVLSIPLGVLSVVLGRSTLPGVLRWFHTHDATLDGGQVQLGWPKKSGLKLALQRASWMRRNPAYGFRAEVLGFKEGKVLPVITSQRSQPGQSGFKQKGYFQRGGKKVGFWYRTNNLWFGWRFPASAGYHIYKLGIRP